MKKAERIYCPAPLPEEQAGPLLMKMLVPMPYKAPKKKAKKEAKDTRGGLHHKGTSDVMSEDTEAHSSAEKDEEEEEEEEESQSTPVGGRKKRTTSTRLEAETSKKGKDSLLEKSTTATDSSPEWEPRVKPLVKS